jgi:ferredoxin
MRVTVSDHLCSGQGRCYVVSPNLFSSDDEGYCAEQGTTREVPPGLEAEARLGADSCPEGAITVSES